MKSVRIATIALSLLLSSHAHAQLGGALGDAAKQVGDSAAGAATGGATGAVAAPTAAPSGGLTGLLMQQLGVTEPQATGGAGAIFGLAKTKMPAEDFSKVAAGVPDMDSLLAAAPAAGGAAGGLTGVTGGLAGAAGGLGGTAGSLGSLAGLAGSFSSLGMSADMVTKFAPVCVQYLQGAAGPETAGLLQAALQ